MSLPRALMLLILLVWLLPEAEARADARGRKTRGLSREKPRPTMRTDGRRFCYKALSRISRRTRQKKRTIVVFDIDNTLVDTRPRTLAAARSFLKARNNHGALRALGMQLVRFDGKQTATRLGLQAKDARDFNAHWERFFWNPGNLKLDIAIKDTVKLAVMAKAAGAEVYYITGRVDAFKEGTLKQLRHHGLPDVDGEHVICKPNPRPVPGSSKLSFTPTAPFKLAQVKRLLGESGGRKLGWFMSDSRDDVATLQKGLGCRSCIWVDFPAKAARKPTPMRGGTPVLKVGL